MIKYRLRVPVLDFSATLASIDGCIDTMHHWMPDDWLIDMIKAKRRRGGDNVFTDAACVIQYRMCIELPPDPDPPDTRLYDFPSVQIDIAD